jgi:osmotically-inducible protein OsmY
MFQSTALMVLPCGPHGDEEARAGQPAALEAAQLPMDHGLAERVGRVLNATGYSPLRAIEVSIHSQLVILRGRVPSYYMKQLAQAAVLDVPGVRALRNDVQVCRRG